MKLIVKNSLLGSILALLILSCNQKTDSERIDTGDNIFLEREYYDGSGSIRTEYRNYKDSNIFVINYRPDGSLSGIVFSQLSDTNFEALYFHSNGRLKSKIMYNLNSENEEGPAFYYYHSGHLKEKSMFQNGVQQGEGYEYWDTTGIIKTAIYYGGYYRDGYRYQASYSRDGVLIKEEGDTVNISLE
ncbi:hypothetical protein ACFLRI_01195 [Bacteroidota bacterium]